MNTRRTVIRRLEAGISLVAVLFLAFVGGVAVAMYRLPPYHWIGRIENGLVDWKHNWRFYLGLEPHGTTPTDRTRGGVVTWDRDRAFEGVTLISAYGANGGELFAIDMKGTVLHRWQLDLETWLPRMRDLKRGFVPERRFAPTHGIWWPQKGRILVFTWLGLVAIDPCSRFLWRFEAGENEQFHHDVNVLENGQILLMTRRRVFEERADRPGLELGKAGFYWDDALVWLSPEGKLQRRVSLIDLFYSQGRLDLILASNERLYPESMSVDPLHSNNVDELPAAWADAFPLFEAGDLLLSLRNTNTIVVLDGEDLTVKWTMRGPFLRQHDPDFLPNGHIIVYDNRVGGAEPVFGPSRVLEIDPATQKIVWQWPDAAHEKQGFYDLIRGRLQQLPNGNLLVVNSLGGRILEIDRASGDIVWEWVNLVAPGRVGHVLNMHRTPGRSLPVATEACPG